MNFNIKEILVVGIMLLATLSVKAQKGVKIVSFDGAVGTALSNKDRPVFYILNSDVVFHTDWGIGAAISHSRFDGPNIPNHYWGGLCLEFFKSCTPRDEVTNISIYGSKTLFLNSDENSFVRLRAGPAFSRLLVTEFEIIHNPAFLPSDIVNWPVGPTHTWNKEKLDTFGMYLSANFSFNIVHWVGIGLGAETVINEFETQIIPNASVFFGIRRN